MDILSKYGLTNEAIEAFMELINEKVYDMPDSEGDYVEFEEIYTDHPDLTINYKASFIRHCVEHDYFNYENEVLRPSFKVEATDENEELIPDLTEYLREKMKNTI